MTKSLDCHLGIAANGWDTEAGFPDWYGEAVLSGKWRTPKKQEAGDAVARKPKRRASARAPKKSNSPRRTSTGGRET